MQGVVREEAIRVGWSQIVRGLIYWAKLLVSYMRGISDLWKVFKQAYMLSFHFTKTVDTI